MEKPKQRIIRCLVNQMIIELTGGIQANIDEFKAKQNKGKGNKAHDDQNEEIHNLSETLKEQTIKYLKYLLEYEQFDYITAHFINTIKFQAIFNEVQEQNDLVQILLNRVLYQQQTNTRVSILKLIQKLQRNNIQISEMLLYENNKKIINELLKDENQVLNIAIQIISNVVSNTNEMPYNDILKTFSNLSLLTISENRHVRDIYFKTFQVTLMSFYQLFKDLVITHKINMQMLPKYVSFVLLDQNILFEQEEFNNFLLESNTYITNIENKKSNLTPQPIANLHELEIWLITCIQIINTQSEEMSQFSFHLLSAFKLLSNKHLMLLQNVNYIISYINTTEYMYILTQPSDECNEHTVKLYQNLLEKQKVEQLVQLISMSRLQCNDQVIVVVNNYLNSIKEPSNQYTVDHLQLVFYLILLIKKQGTYNQELFNTFFKLANVLSLKYFNQLLTIEWIIEHDNQMKLQLIMQILSGIIRGFPKYLNTYKQLTMAQELYLQCFLKLYQLKYDLYDKMDQSSQEEEKEQCIYIIQGIDMLFQQTVSLCSEKELILEFVLSICCLDAPVLRKQFNAAIANTNANLYSIALQVYQNLRMQKLIEQTGKLTLQAVLLDFRKLFFAGFRAKNDHDGLEKFKKYWENNQLEGQSVNEAPDQKDNKQDQQPE